MLASLAAGLGYVALPFLMGAVKNDVPEWIEKVLSVYASFAAAAIGIISFAYSIFHLKILGKNRKHADKLSVNMTRSERSLAKYELLGFGWFRKVFMGWFTLTLAYGYYIFLAVLYVMAYD